MHRRLPTILSVLLLLLVLCLALFLQRRGKEPQLAATEPQPVAAELGPTARVPTEAAAEDRDGLVGPDALRDALPAYRRCLQEHGGAGSIPAGETTLLFTIAVDPAAPRRLGRVTQVRVKLDDQASPTAEPSPFERCAQQAVAALELIAPGARDELRIPIGFELSGP